MNYTDDELKQIVETNLRQALGAPDSKVSRERLRNFRAYLAEPVEEWAAPEIEDRSNFVATDVADTIEWMLPSLLRVFASSTKAIDAVAKRQQGEKQAKTAGEVLRYHFWEKSNGFTVLNDWIKDGLMQKVGFVSVQWEAKEVDIEETYREQTEPQLQMLLDDDKVEVISGQQYEIQVTDPMGQQVPVPVYDVTIRRKSPETRCKLEPIPPEEMRIGAGARYTDRRPYFIAQKTRKTRGALKAEGFKDIDDIAAGDTHSEEEIERAGTSRSLYDSDEDDTNRDAELLRFVDAYILLDGKKYTRCIIIGEELNKREDADDHRFRWWCPNPLPHVFFGQCPADQALGPQQLHTNLIRAIEDNVYLTVNSRTEVGVNGLTEDTINDLLDNRPGGIVRTKMAGSIVPLVQPNLAEGAWSFTEWVEQWKEMRTGFSRISKGLSPDTLNTETATGVLELTERADMRTELIARQVANSLEWVLETMLKCISEYQDVQEAVRINGEWVDYDPRDWANQFTIKVNCGMGAGNKDRRAAGLRELGQTQAMMVGAGITPPQASVMLMRDLASSLGEDAPEKYFPDAVPPPPPPPDPKLEVERMRQEGKQAEIQTKAQIEAQTAQAELMAEQQRKQMEVQAQAQIAANEQEAQARQELVRQQVELQMAEREKAMDARMQAMQNAFDAQQNERDRQLQLALAQIKGQQQAQQAAQQRQHDHIQGRLGAEDAQNMKGDD